MTGTMCAHQVYDALNEWSPSGVASMLRQSGFHNVATVVERYDIRGELFCRFAKDRLWRPPFSLSIDDSETIAGMQLVLWTL